MIHSTYDLLKRYNRRKIRSSKDIRTYHTILSNDLQKICVRNSCTILSIEIQYQYTGTISTDMIRIFSKDTIGKRYDLVETIFVPVVSKDTYDRSKDTALRSSHVKRYASKDLQKILLFVKRCRYDLTRRS